VTISRWHFIYRIASLINITRKVSPVLFTAMILLYGLAAVMPLASMYITKLVIDTIVAIVQNRSDYSTGLFWLILQAVVGLLVFIVGMVQQIAIKRYSQKVSFYFQHEILNKSSSIPFIYFDNAQTYETITRARNSGGEVFSLFTTLFELVKNSITVCGYLALLSTVHWLLPVAMIVLAIPSLYFHIKLGNKRYLQVVEQTSASRRAGYLYNILLGRDVAKEIRVFGHHHYLIDMWRKLYWENADAQYHLEKKAGGVNLVINCIRDISSVLFIAVLLWLATKGTLTIGDYYMFTQGISLSLVLVNNISDNLARIRTNVLFMTDYFELMEYQEESAVAKEDIEETKRLAVMSKITVDHISFAYPNQKDLTLNNISFNIFPGEKIAIVGSNGAGKSTLVKCLMGLYPVSSGELYIDSIPISVIDRKKLRHKFSVIFQDYVHYLLTVRENIALGKVERLDDAEAIRQVAATSGADEFISKLQNGWETEVGAGFFGGQELSGGQWQKIALSRALFKDAEIIILDEPTAALDPIAEADLLRKFVDIAKNKTAIFITHRLGSCKSVDRILVLKDGRLVEEGSHQQLMDMDGEYAYMFRSQAQWYV